MSAKHRSLNILAMAALGLTGLAAGFPNPALAAKAVTIEACVIARKPTSALMSPGDKVLFEVDLRGVPNSQFALQQDECVTIVGLDRDDEPGLREFPGRVARGGASHSGAPRSIAAAAPGTRPRQLARRWHRWLVRREVNSFRGCASRSGLYGPTERWPARFSPSSVSIFHTPWFCEHLQSASSRPEPILAGSMDQPRRRQFLQGRLGLGCGRPA